MSHDPIDPTEQARRILQADVNTDPATSTRELLVRQYGADDVFDTDELQAAFDVVGFLAPYCMVVRKRDGRKGTVRFRHSPRFYFGFVAD